VDVTQLDLRVVSGPEFEARKREVPYSKVALKDGEYKGESGQIEYLA
jgi:hypothetical protein